jgi:hypothetical protein
MKVLIGCEESQTVCKAFRDKGHEAYSCDIQHCSGGHPEWHIKGDVLVEAYSGKYDMMIAHPPCTYISRAGARWMYLSAGILNMDRYNIAMLAKELFLKLLNAPISKIAIENPTPLKIIELPPPTTYVQPFEFGHPYSKKTLLWLKNLQPLMPTKIMAQYKPFLPSNTGGAKRGQKHYYTNISQKESSKTFEGIAKAMAEQWG